MTGGPSGRPRLVTTPAELQTIAAELLTGRTGTSLGLVPTMGALHEGHAALADAARRDNDVVVASVFVNPLQFSETADLDRYPRTLEADLDLLGGCGVDLVFAPGVDDVYPAGPPRVRVSSGAQGGTFEGASRPGHFDGALTVVAKLLHLAQPRPAAGYRAYFGQKDAQQLFLVRRMVTDLSFPVDIRAVPTVRADDGLALSSRNRFLAPEERTAATVLYRSLRRIAEEVAAGRAPDIPAARAMVAQEPLVHLDYLEVVGADSFEPLPPGGILRQPAVAVIAAQVGAVRLIDNLPLG